MTITAAAGSTTDPAATASLDCGWVTTPGGGPVTGTAAHMHLVALVAAVQYKPGWTFKVGGPLGRFLCVMARTVDSQHYDRRRNTQHMFELPTAVPGDRQFYRWVFDRLLLCELHEAGEFFAVGDLRPFYPNHQDEGSPYERVERWEDHHDAETTDTASA